MSEPGIVLIIAATDSTCGAGAFQDARVVTELGMIPMVAETAMTVQTGEAVLRSDPAKRSSLREVFRTDLERNVVFKLRAVKIGLIPTEKIFQAVVSFLIRLREIRGADFPVVWDPVTIAGNGDPLADYDIRECAQDLMPLASLITPNISEAMNLSGTSQSLDSIESCGLWARTVGDWFAEAGADSVYIKGGHLEQYTGNPDLKGTILNMLVKNVSSSIAVLTHRRTLFPAGEPGRVHGTGCALSAAVAAFLGQNLPLEEALVRAEMYVSGRIRESRAVFSGMRILGDGGTCPAFEDLPLFFPCFQEFRSRLSASMPAFPECPEKLGLYPVLPDNDWVLRCLQAGVRTLQLRIKKWDSQEQLRQEIRRAVELGRKYHARVFIDDHWELAVQEKAYGVHLGQEDLEAADLELIRNAGLRLGVSTHSYAEAARALQVKPSYIALGHIFPTSSKIMPSAPQGTTRLADYVRILGRSYPLVAIGGIKIANAPEVLKTGVGSVAVITAITETPDPGAAIREWQELLRKFGIQDSDELFPDGSPEAEKTAKIRTAKGHKDKAPGSGKNSGQKLSKKKNSGNRKEKSK